MWLKAPNIHCTHGFSDRHGGVSKGPHHSLNLGGSQDLTENIEKNRSIALSELQLSPHQLCTLKQVHGNTVCIAKPGKQEGDALVTNEKGLVLAVGIADCYPLLFHDEMNGVVGAAQAGWRGTCSLIAETTLKAMFQLGAKPEHIKVAIGQGISQSNFEVGDEVIQTFEKAGFPSFCWEGRHINLVKCNIFVLLKNHIFENNIWSMNRCTFESDFFSHRRDKGLTGRMWGLISL